MRRARDSAHTLSAVRWTTSSGCPRPCHIDRTGWWARYHLRPRDDTCRFGLVAKRSWEIAFVVSRTLIGKQQRHLVSDCLHSPLWPHVCAFDSGPYHLLRVDQPDGREDHHQHGLWPIGGKSGKIKAPREHRGFHRRR